MKKRREVKWMIFLLLFWATSLIVRSANVVNYYHTISTMPTPLLYKKAENFYKHDHADSALICYTIITKRTPVNRGEKPAQHLVSAVENISGAVQRLCKSQGMLAEITGIV